MHIFSSLFITLTIIEIGVSEIKMPYFADIGYCAQSQLVENFDFAKYSGHWFQQMEVPNTYSHSEYCGELDVVATDRATSYTVNHEGLDSYYEFVNQTATLTQYNSFLHIPYLLLNSTDAPSVTYNVIATDYDSYACTYSCLNIYNIKVELFWVLGRARQMPEPSRDACLRIFESMDLDVSKLVPVQQNETVCLNPKKFRESLESSFESREVEKEGDKREEEISEVEVPNLENSAEQSEKLEKNVVITSNQDNYDERIGNGSSDSKSNVFSSIFLSLLLLRFISLLST